MNNNYIYIFVPVNNIDIGHFNGLVIYNSNVNLPVCWPKGFC